jgi:hypothetical protein
VTVGHLGVAATKRPSDNRVRHVEHPSWAMDRSPTRWQPGGVFTPVSARTATILFVLTSALFAMTVASGVMLLQGVVAMLLAGQVYAGSTRKQ